ncbi:MAG: scavenger receptor cysteine-rich domain-containing protein, partial [Endozoicomonadaceae bacterium]|nr:scavenger receptor cysteine-rich domain-containing protein [Endozoicomonadaceae bacterium]
GEFSGTFSTGVYSLKGFPVNGITPFFESINNSHIECNVPLKSGEIPANAQPLLTRRALHANKVETTLQWPDNPDHAYYTYPVAGNITGDHNKFIVKNSVSRSAEVFYWNYFLEQKDTGIIATEVSGDRNSLDLQGEIHVFKTVNNKVPGNIAKTISGSYNRLIQKGPFVVSSTLNSDKISLTIDRSDTSVESSGLLEVSVPVEGTNSSEWGTVCDEGFSSLSGFVACRQLGFDTGYKDDTEHQCSSRSVLLSNVRCLGNETSLLECPHDVAGEHNCTQPPVELRCTNLKNYNNNTVLYSGLLGRTPEFATNTAVAFWDRAGYVDFNGLLRENSVDTTKPNDWRIAQQHLCASEKCTTSCHYVNEQFHSVINHGNKTLLVTRQHYPIVSFFPLDGLAEQEAKGVIRVTDISKPGANGTIQLYHPPVDNPHLGAQNASDPSVYTPPVSEVVINDTLLSLHRRPAFYDLSGLKFLEPNDEAPGVQLSELSLDGTNSTYNSVTYDFPGEDALLLNENAVFTHNKANHTIIQRSLNSDGQHYTISETNVTYQLPAEPLIATGTDEGYMYVVTKEQVSDNSTGSTNLIFSRYNLSNNERDVSWNRSVQPNDLFDDEGNYKLLFSDDEIQLLRRGELFSLNDVPYALQVPHGGGCSEIRNKQALMASVEATTSQTVLQPTSMVVSQPTSSLSPSPTSSLSPPPTSSSSNKNEKNDVVAIASGVAVAAVSTLGATVIVAALCKKHCENKKRFTVDSIMHENADLPETKGRYTKKEETATKNLENPTEEPKKYKTTEV